MKAIITKRGQVTIPKALRQILCLKPGTVLNFEIKNGSLVVTKVVQRNPVDQIYGCLGKLNTDRIIKHLRGSDISN